MNSVTNIAIADLNSIARRVRMPMRQAASFESALQQAQHGSVSEARQVARDFVSTALITPLLAELREEPFQAKLFHGGMAEDAFRRQFDQIVGDRIVAEMDQRGGLPLIDQLHQHIERQSRTTAAREVNILG